jgi:hypothetical protein
MLLAPLSQSEDVAAENVSADHVGWGHGPSRLFRRLRGAAEIKMSNAPNSKLLTGEGWHKEHTAMTAR